MNQNHRAEIFSDFFTDLSRNCSLFSPSIIHSFHSAPPSLSISLSFSFSHTHSLFLDWKKCACSFGQQTHKSQHKMTARDSMNVHHGGTLVSASVCTCTGAQMSDAHAPMRMSKGLREEKPSFLCILIFCNFSLFLILINWG